MRCWPCWREPYWRRAPRHRNFDRSGPYLAAGSLVAIETFDVGDFDNGGGLDVRLGYRLTPHLSFDLLYQYATMNGSVSGMGVDVSTWLFALGPKLHLLTGRIQPYLAAGIGIQHMRFKLPGFRIEGDDSLARVAGGIDLVRERALGRGRRVRLRPTARGVRRFRPGHLHPGASVPLLSPPAIGRFVQ